MRDHFGWFVLLLFVVINIIQLAAPINATAVILATVLMPLAQVNGVNEWLVGFIILMFSEIWWFPTSAAYYLPMQQMNREQPFYDDTPLPAAQCCAQPGATAGCLRRLPILENAGDTMKPEKLMLGLFMCGAAAVRLVQHPQAQHPGAA
jgi:hypothetical protein